MVRGARSGPARRVWASKTDLLSGGGDVAALTYERASQDKKEQGKSVSDQRKLNLTEVDRHQWRCVGSFQDNDRSASRHARKDRPQFELLMEAIRAGKGDVLVIWEIARSQRDLAVYVAIRDLCVEVGLRFWLVGGQLYDLTDRNDRMVLGFQAVQAEFFSDYVRDNVNRGMAGAAEAGKPHGKVTYGYERVYDSRTKALLRQQPDTVERTATAEDGTETLYSPAGVVRDLFRDVAAGVPLIKIEQGLNARGVPSSMGKAWRRGVIRKIALNPAYIGKRVYQGKVVSEGIWPALVDEDTFWAVARLLGDPARTTTRAGRAVHLLSYIVTCDVCSGPISAGMVNRHGWTGRVYSCLNKRCAAVKADVLDEYVQRAVVAWMALPATYEALTAGRGDEDVAAARAEINRLHTDLEQWTQAAKRGDVTPISFAVVEKARMADIARETERMKEASVPPVLRGRIGPLAAQSWKELENDLAVKREIIKVVADIRLQPTGKGSRQKLNRERLVWRWKLGANAAELPER